ncbi:FAD/NAD(P)-binding domain-containing protein [Hypoxylon trugodes]|uniref:FAD/NAD(P)-binding domain-containing protein n=1 Tax=Hypoxylon trugodes TaxID=326681 RepID=UPI00218E9EEA|nr:FAD/NAD(P)-binding domain-containing protein [Hypoxylon trugodes]KAI1390690.1 FAD/NAD(P)-binding domain-containing protein [Hypoxylon trugodes]
MGSTEWSMPLQLKNEPLDGHRPIKVRVIGAGYSGIYLGIRIPQRIRNVDFQIYEQNESVGGTWWVNKYPGCACDIPSHSYQYTFNPNPNWSAFYAPQREICAYLQGTAEKYGVLRFVKLLHKVESCQWDDGKKKWILKVRRTDTNETFEDDADMLVAARGNLSDPAWPKIPGLKSFEGEIMHSAVWNENYDFKNKRVGIIGNGSSAIQIVPSLQKIEGTKLSCFVRSKTWITNPFGDSVMAKLGLKPTQLQFTPEQRREFAENPEKLFAFRKIIEVDGSTIHDVSLRDSEMQRGAMVAFSESMKNKLAARPEISDFLIPSFGIGCRRSTPGPGYLEALIESNVDFITDPIEVITPTGVALKSGRSVPVDTLVCATGFNTSSAPPFPIYGRGGLSLQERFTPYPSAYLSVAVDSFPNFFMMLGPNSAIGSGSLTSMLEKEGDYIVKCIRKLQKEDYATMTVKPERMRDWDEYCLEYFKKTVYTDTCHSWYKSEGGSGDRIIGVWPGSPLHALEALRSPRWEDYNWESVGGDNVNKLRWLGNGWSITHSKGEGENEWGGDPGWYIEPRFVDFPVPGQPEDDPEYKLRPFSH